MTQKHGILEGIINAYGKHVALLDHMSIKDYLWVDRQHCLVVPSSHHLYQYLQNYMKERLSWLERHPECVPDNDPGQFYFPWGEKDEASK